MVKSLYLKRNKKGQAAIEFLMTYGWMLLVVLIVGALIFSFVDFGQLLPNTLDLNNNFRGDAAQNQARDSSDSVLITFTYNGNDRVSINASDSDASFIVDPVIGACGIAWIKNVDTDEASAATSPGFGISGTSGGSSTLTFLRGQEGLAEFSCDGSAPVAGEQDASNLIENDVFEGQIRITAENARTSVPIRSEGNIRVGVSS